MVWSIMEPEIAVMVCALPCYRGYLSWASPSNFSSFLRSAWGSSSQPEDGFHVSSHLQLRPVEDSDKATSEMSELQECGQWSRHGEV